MPGWFAHPGFCLLNRPVTLSGVEGSLASIDSPPYFQGGVAAGRGG